MPQSPLHTSAVLVSTAPERRRVDRPSQTATVAVLALGDMIASFVAVLSALAVGALVGAEVGQHEVLLLLTVVPLAPAAFGVAGLYPGIGLSRVDELRLLTVFTAIVFLALLLAMVILGRVGNLPLGLVAWGMVSIAVPLTRALVRSAVSARRWWGVPVVVLGAGRAGSTLIRRLVRDPGAGLVPVAAFDDDPALLGTLIHGVPVAGTLSDSGRCAEDGVRHALLAMPSVAPHRLQAVVRSHARRFPSLIVVPDILGLGSFDASVCSFDGMMGFRVRQNLLVRRNLALKRVMDLCLLIPATVLALPVVAVAAALVRLVDAGSPFYAQERIGRGGQKFKVWKLRTMYVDAEERLARYLEEDSGARQEWYTKFKLTHDARILPGIGTFLRVSSLDELPQLWNIAKGEMSFVGPRPFPAYHLDAFDEEFRELRTQVAPGLTGLWQVTARSNSDLALQEELDSLYIANWSPWADVYLLACTPWAVIRGHGAV